MLFRVLIFYFGLFGGIQLYSQTTQLYKESYTLMGSDFDITVVSDNEDAALKFIEMARREITRVENLISSWDSNSETSLINKNAGIKPVKVSKELWGLIQRSLQVSKITSGAFDITYAAVDNIWKFDGSVTSMPNPEIIKSSISKIGFSKIILNEEKQTVFLPTKGMKIGFGAIGKGYAADRAKDMLIEAGVKAGIINASGDMNTWGTQPDGTPWSIGIINPLNKEKVFSWFLLKHNAVVTSGNYEKHITIDGQRFSHIIDPRTGIPSKDIISSTIFASKAELADALATAIFVMGVDSGLFLINQLPDVEAILIDDLGKVHKSKNIAIENN